MTGLDALRQRGWKVDVWDRYGARIKRQRFTFIDMEAPDGEPAFNLRHKDPHVAERMALVAALEAEGHDLLALLRDWWEKGNMPDVRARTRAVLDAAGDQT